MPSYSFNSTIQSIIQSIINFFEKLFGITRGQPIKTQLPTNTKPLKTIGKYHPPPSYIINHLNKNILYPKLPILPLPIITRHKVNIENPPKINNRLPILPMPIITRYNVNIENPPKINNRLPILPMPIITRYNVNIENPNKILLPKLPILPIKIIPNKSLSQVLNNNSKTNNTPTNTSSTNTLSTNTSSTKTSTSSTNNTSTTNLSQIAINPNVPLSQTLTQGRTIIASKPKNPNPTGNNGNNSSQSNNSNSKLIIVNPIEYQLYNKNINTKSNNRKTNIIKRWLNGIKISTSCLFIA